MQQRTGFTLIEMLVVVMIITMLAGMTLSALGTARNYAAAARTRATIEKINRVVMKHYASYQYRRVDIDDTNDKAKAAQAKLDQLRILMRMEMPDRYSDLSLKDSKPAITVGYQEKCNDSKNKTTFKDYMAAELLYMQVMADPVGAGMFSEGEIGDFDGDGLPEFIDGWGHPIRYLLWPAGFFQNNGCESDLQVTTATGTEQFVHDPFDVANLDQSQPALFPLIYSAGPDGIYDINLGKNGSGTDASTTSYPKSSLDPYGFKDGNGHKIGDPWNDTKGGTSELHHYDNITNHTLLSN